MAVSVKETAPSPEVYNFNDVVQHISNTSYRDTDIDYDDSVSVTYNEPIYKSWKLTERIMLNLLRLLMN